MRRILTLGLVAPLWMAAGGGAVTAVQNEVQRPVQSRTQESRREITGETVMAIQAWVTAVTEHSPGHDDKSVRAIQAMSFDARVELNAGLAHFFSALKGQSVVVTGEAPIRIREIGRAARQRPGREEFLKRAALLHSDAAVYGELGGVEPGAPADMSRPGAPTTPLLSNHRLTLDKDGEVLGSVAADWNWPFARSLLDLIPGKPGDDPFIGTWYHATLAYMVAKGEYGEMTPHLQRAAEVLPDDARILFDRACYAEIMGLPKTQVLLSDDDVFALEARRTGRRLPRTTVGGAAELGIPLAVVTNEEAERLFRRALKVDPDYVEARVRLARLLEVRKRHDEAAGELATALAAKPTGYVAYYAHLFAGRAAQALGRIDDAMAHYREASALYPGAQSALLAESQAALLSADVPGTLAPIDHLDHSSTARDPWWQYDLAAGRDADAILADMWGQVPRF
jgi:tetratricopeptide (TPR) repeat protein